MLIVVTGCTGYVGRHIVRDLSRGHQVVGIARRPGDSSREMACDLTEISQVRELRKQYCPDVIVHAAGIKDIRRCEEQPDLARAVNCESVKNLARVFGDKSRLVYVSTDYVFDGRVGGYSEHDDPDPTTEYGKSKLCGERAVLENPELLIPGAVLRTGAVFDLTASFPAFLLDRLSQRKTVQCYDDIFYSPTYWGDFVAAVRRVIEEPTPSVQRVFHVCGERTSRYLFARTFCSIFGFDEELVEAVSGVGNDHYLLPDLSLRNDITRELLGLPATDLITAFRFLRGFENNEAHVSL